MKMTYEQYKFLVLKDINVGDVFQSSVGDSLTILAGPSLDSERFEKDYMAELRGNLELKEILEDGKLLKMNFLKDSKKPCPDFYVLRSDIEQRGIIEFCIIGMFYAPYCWIKNYFSSLKK